MFDKFFLDCEIKKDRNPIINKKKKLIKKKIIFFVRLKLSLLFASFSNNPNFLLVNDVCFSEGFSK